ADEPEGLIRIAQELVDLSLVIAERRHEKGPSLLGDGPRERGSHQRKQGGFIAARKDYPRQAIPVNA
ncbi:MAG TPA: hypothetical protein VKU84_15845, partial [Stellaceae bacterium]|nr:hypothetical protein [Stellaceae bacterium]